MRDAVDSNQRVSRFCEPLPTAVIPIRAEAASPDEDLTFRSYSLLISFFLHKRNRPFCVIASRTPLPEHQVASKSPFSPLPEPPALLCLGREKGGRRRPRRGFWGRPPVCLCIKGRAGL